MRLTGQVVRPVSDCIILILRTGSPFEVDQAVVRRVPVKVSRHRAVRPFASKCRQDQPVNREGLEFGVADERDPQVPFGHLRGFANLGGHCVLAAI